MGTSVTLTAFVAARIQERIATGEYHPGDQLPNESMLAEAYQVSRAVVRDATKILVGQGVLELVRGRGVFVKSSAGDRPPILPIPTVSSIQQLYETRRALELQIARSATVRATPSEIRKLERIVAAAEKWVSHDGSPGRLLSLDNEFHLQLARAAHNEVMLHLILQLEDLLVMARLHSLRIAGRPALSVQEHRRVVNHLIRRDPEGTSAAMYLHLTAVETSLLVPLQPENPSSPPPNTAASPMPPSPDG